MRALCGINFPKFNAESVNKALKETKFNLICGVPTLYEKLFNDKNDDFKFQIAGDVVSALNSEYLASGKHVTKKYDNNALPFASCIYI